MVGLANETEVLVESKDGTVYIGLPIWIGEFVVMVVVSAAAVYYGWPRSFPDRSRS